MVYRQQAETCAMRLGLTKLRCAIKPSYYLVCLQEMRRFFIMDAKAVLKEFILDCAYFMASQSVMTELAGRIFAKNR